MGEKIGKVQSIHLYLFIACTVIFLCLHVRPFGTPSSKLASLLNPCVEALRMTRTVNIDEGEGGSTQSVEPHYRFFLPCMDSEASDFLIFSFQKHSFLTYRISAQVIRHKHVITYHRELARLGASALLLTRGSSQRHTYHDNLFSQKPIHSGGSIISLTVRSQ